MKKIIEWLLSHGWENTDACMFTKEKTEQGAVMIVNGQKIVQNHHSRYGIELYGDGWISGDNGCEVLHFVSFTKRTNGMLMDGISSGVRDLDEFLSEAVAVGTITPDEL